MSASRGAPKVPVAIERFVKALVVCSKAVALYPPASTIPRDTAQEASNALNEVLTESPELRFIVTKQGLFYQEIPVLHGQPGYEHLALELYNRKLAEVRFHAGCSAVEIVSFLSLLDYTPEETEAAGGFENLLWEKGVATITVLDAHLSIVASKDVIHHERSDVSTPPISREEVDALLADAYGGRPRDQLTLVQFLGDTSAVNSYLNQTLGSADGVFGLMATGERFAQLAEIAYGIGGDGDPHELLASLGAALADLDPVSRRTLLFDQLLPEARTNEALAAVIRQVDTDEMCSLFVTGAGADEISQEGLARAIRNLSLISMVDRDEVVFSAETAMRGAGYGPGLVDQVLELASPSKLTVSERSSARPQPEQPADAIFRLMDLAPNAGRGVVEGDDPGLTELREEARRGVTDGDIIMAMVSLAGLDSRDVQFATTMSLLEDSLDLLIERGDLDIAADAADALRAATRSPGVSHDQRRRLERAIGRFTKPADVRTVAHALRLYRPDTVEHEAARRLLDAMGSLAIEPLLEQLAEEPDMAVRKTIVDVLSKMAPDYIGDLGAHVTDSRWYVVRNVVSILGSTRSTAVLPYLERTVRHPEPRVRREAIRALSGVVGRLSDEMLVASLFDDDAQNVQLAARYLGASGTTAAIPALEKVARGEGRGNRDSGPRVEAIEALGRLRAHTALPTLELLAGRRWFKGAGRIREVRSAAESAITRIKTGGGAL